MFHEQYRAGQVLVRAGIHKQQRIGYKVLAKKFDLMPRCVGGAWAQKELFCPFPFVSCSRRFGFVLVTARLSLSPRPLYQRGRFDVPCVSSAASFVFSPPVGRHCRRSSGTRACVPSPSPTAVVRAAAALISLVRALSSSPRGRQVSGVRRKEATGRARVLAPRGEERAWEQRRSDPPLYFCLCARWFSQRPHEGY